MRCSVAILISTILLVGQGAGQVSRQRPMTLGITAEPVAPIPAEALRRFSTIEPRLQPAARTWAEEQARAQERLPVPDAAAVNAAARRRFGNPAEIVRQAGVDIEGLVFLVMVKAAQDAEQDLKQIMLEAKQANDAKQQLRQVQQQIDRELAANRGSVKKLCETPACRALPARVQAVTEATASTSRPIHLELAGPVTYLNMHVLQKKVQEDVDRMEKQAEEDEQRARDSRDHRKKILDAISKMMDNMSGERPHM
jgi:hypothetical protein